MNKSRPDHGWRYRLAILAIAAAAIALRWFAYNPWDQHHADEFYQYLEQANRLVAGYGLVPWESRNGIRGALIPQFLSLPIRIGDLIEPAGMLPIHLARLSFAALCLLGLAGAWGIGAARSRRHALVALFVAAIWFDGVQFSVLVLSEAAATAVISCGAALLLIEKPERRHLWAAGFLLILSTLLRFQYAPFVAVLVLARVRLDWRTWRKLAIGGVAALVLGVISDLADGRVPMLWILDNLRLNIGAGRAAEFGEEGPWFYAEMLRSALGPAVPAILAIALLAGRRYWPLMLAVAVNIALHTLIGHKEYRFIWLSVFLILVLGGIGSVSIVDWLLARRRLGQTASWWALPILCAGWLGLSQTVLGEAAAQRLTLKGGADAMAAHEVAAHPEVCGLAVPEDRTDHVATFLLRRNVPIYQVPVDMADGLSSMAPELAHAANAVIASDELMLNPEYRVIACHQRADEKACLLVRPGGCNPAGGAEYEVQKVLIRTGM